MDQPRQSIPFRTSASNPPTETPQYAILGDDGTFRGVFQPWMGHKVSELAGVEVDCKFTLVERRDPRGGLNTFSGELNPFNHSADVFIVLDNQSHIIGLVFFDEGYGIDQLVGCRYLPISRGLHDEDIGSEVIRGFVVPADVFAVWSDPTYSNPEPAGSHLREPLCFDCLNLGISVNDFDAKDDKEDRKLFSRSLKSLREVSSCSLCRLVVHAIDSTRPTWEKDKHVSDEDVVCKAWLQWHRFPATKKFRVIDITTNFPFHGPSYGAQLFPIQRAQHRFLGRLLDPQAVQPALIRKWLQRCCQKHHGDGCSSKTNSRFAEIAEHLLCIDVETQQLVRPIENSRYVALSYVWGKKPMTLLKKDQLVSWSSPGGLDSVIHGLPNVIKDAINLTAKIGVRFLKMNLVYQAAFLTIFAATGEDADAGLPGVRNNTRDSQQSTARVNAELSFICPPSHSNLSQSTWASRGWTYQEYFFSKRRLIFHNGMMTWKCNTTTWREDLALENFGAHINQFDLSQGFGAASEKWDPPSSIISGPEARQEYGKWLRAYMNRDLSFDSDALNAFAGILDFSTLDLAFETYFGLSEMTFGLDMLWEQEMFMTRRPEFPSWSWAGWKGRLLPPFHDTQSVLRQHYFSRWTSWYKWEPNDRISPIADFEDEEFWQIRRNTHLNNRFDTARSPLLALVAMYNKLRHTGEDYRADTLGQAALYELKQLSHISDDRMTELTLFLAGLQSACPVLLFKTITAEVWILALTPDNSISEISGPIPYAHMVLRPALHLYSTVGPDFEPIGLAWLNEESIHKSIRDATISAADGLTLTKEPDPSSQPMYSASRGRNAPANDEDTIKKMREMIDLIGQEPDGTENLLPQDPSQPEIALKARRIRKVPIAFLTGPLEGSNQSRIGTAKSYPYTTHRGFFRVIVLSQVVHTIAAGNDMAATIPQRLGVGELELFALDKLPDLQVKEILLR